MKQGIKKVKSHAAAILALVVLILAGACESVLFIELEESDKLIVLNGAISSDSAFAVQVSRTRHILDNAPLVPLESAVVTLYENGSELGSLTGGADGIYRSAEIIPVIGAEYRVRVESSGYPTVSATCVIPPAVGIASVDTITIEPNEEPSFYDWYYYESQLQFDLTLHDPPGVDNYYLLNLEADRSYTEWRDTTVIIIDSLYYGDQWNYYPRDSTYTVGDIFRFTDRPHITSQDIVVEAITSDGILFSDQLIDGKQYSFRGSIMARSLGSADSSVVDFRLNSISETYYKYLKSRQKHYDTKDNYLAVPVIVYSNVESGTGFLGGYSTDVYTITTFVPEYGYDYWYRYDDNLPY